MYVIIKVITQSDKTQNLKTTNECLGRLRLPKKVTYSHVRVFNSFPPPPIIKVLYLRVEQVPSDAVKRNRESLFSAFQDPGHRATRNWLHSIKPGLFDIL